MRKPWIGLIILITIIGCLTLAACGRELPNPEPRPTPAEETAAAEETEERPALTAHVPFLYTDERGFIRPEEPLDTEELALALKALLKQPEALALPERQTVTAELLRDCLRELLSEEDLACFPAEGTISRADFAVGICRILDSGTDERILPAEGAHAPADLPEDAPYYEQMMEACVPHEPGGTTGWARCGLETGREPGVFWLDGCLYYCGETGRLLKNTSVGPLYFGEDGTHAPPSGMLSLFKSLVR